MNIQNIQDLLISGKWMMEKKSLYQFYNLVNRMSTGKFEYMKNGQIPEIQMENDNDGDICIIRISGILVKGCSLEEEEVLGLVNTDEISNQLEDAANDPTIKAIILAFYSPGGETTGISELGRKIKYIDENIKPIYSWTEKQMASAAAWAGTQARAIGMTESANIGACGVYMIVPDNSEKYKMEGTNHQIISSGKYKMMGQDIRPLTEEETKILIEDVELQHNKFKQVIKANRPNIDEDCFEGLSYEGNEALKKGWVDYVCDSLPEFLQRIDLL